MESESALDVSEGASAILRFFQARRSGLNLYLYTRFRRAGMSDNYLLSGH